MNRIATFRTVVFVWLVMCFVGAVVYIVSGTLNPIDALFESVSGFTTTGLTVIAEPEFLPEWLLLWRSFTHWVGGMGVLALLFALLPYLDEHPAQLMLTESPGPVKGKLVSKTKETARLLYAIYFVITFILFLLLFAGGMKITDAAIHTFSTVGTGGFSNRNLSVMSYNNSYFEIVITIFMFICSVNFNLFYLLILKRVRESIKSEEFKWLLIIFTTATIVITCSILPLYNNFGLSLRHAAFHAASSMSTTGFYSTDFSKWPMIAQMMLIVLMFIGGSAGSTAGGLKVSRLILLARSLKRGLKQIISPNLVEVVRLDNKPVEEISIRSALTYFLVYALVMIVSVILLSFDKYTFETNFLITTSAFNNIGLGWGEIGALGNLSGYSIFSKLILILDMLLGRLEIYPLLFAFVLKPKKTALR